MADTYSDPRYGVVKSAPVGQIDMNIAVDSRRAQWSPPQDEDNANQRTVIKRCTAVVDTAGTLTGTTLNIFNGTTSIGVIAVGTGVVNTQLASAAMNTLVTSGDIINFRNSGSDATVKLRPSIEYADGFLA